MLTEQQRRYLLDLARTSIEAEVNGKRPAMPAIPDLPHASGVFVTIKRDGALRGCLGTLDARCGLAEEVARCAAESAVADPRFPPVCADELPGLAVQISVLGPLEPIEPRVDAFAVGTHGLVVEQGRRRGLLLPQVALEWGWTPDAFLRQTCVKAGLPADAWAGSARLYRFTAEVFGD